MATKSFTSLEQSKKLAEILPLESADMYLYLATKGNPKARFNEGYNEYGDFELPCWSLTALLNVLPEINGISLTLEKVKAEDGYEGYYYYTEYNDIVLIPYSKNPVDACYEMILKLNELKML